MAVQHYRILAAAHPYNPRVGQDITYRLTPDPAYTRFASGLKETNMTFRVTYREDSWGPDTLRVEGYIYDSITGSVQGVRGHHKIHSISGSNSIGLLEVSSDD